jgi:hypothetical protein
MRIAFDGPVDPGEDPLLTIRASAAGPPQAPPVLRYRLRGPSQGRLPSLSDAGGILREGGGAGPRSTFAGEAHGPGGHHPLPAFLGRETGAHDWAEPPPLLPPFGGPDLRRELGLAALMNLALPPVGVAGGPGFPPMRDYRHQLLGYGGGAGGGGGVGGGESAGPFRLQGPPGYALGRSFPP